MTDPNDEDFAAMLAEFERAEPRGGRRGPKEGEMVKGQVVSVGSEAVFLDLGGKSEGMLSLDQVSDADGNVTVAVGDVVEARVVDAGGKSGTVVLRRHMSRGPEAKAELLQAFEHGIPVEGVVIGAIKGGVEVQVAGVRAFCPVSQLDNRFVEDPEAYVGRRLSFRVTRYEPGRGETMNLVVSRRALLEEEAAARAVETRARLEVGAVFSGTVTTIKPYGAFVDIGGVEGMLHVSELGHVRVDRPEDVLSVGQSVEVCVIKIEQTGDPKRPEKLSLSLKALEQDPWQDAARRFGEGTRVTGTVVRVQPFGAFVELSPGIEGLVHISELGAGRRINHPREVVTVGQAVDVTVLGVDLERRRIALSMGASAAEAAGAADAAAYAPKQVKSLGTLGDLLKKKL